MLSRCFNKFIFALILQSQKAVIKWVSSRIIKTTWNVHVSQVCFASQTNFQLIFCPFEAISRLYSPSLAFYLLIKCYVFFSFGEHEYAGSVKFDFYLQNIFKIVIFSLATSVIKTSVVCLNSDIDKMIISQLLTWPSKTVVKIFALPTR